jgi:ABC-type phosphate transport system substrate-binding protein
MRARIIIVAIALVALVLSIASAADNGSSRFKIIVHPDNRVDSLSRDFLRNAYLKKSTTWSHGGTIRPVDLSSKLPVRDQFTHEVIRKTPAQLKTYWNQQIFSGKGVPPPEVESAAAAIAYVLANPGAVGYLPADADPGKAKVVRIK